MLEKLRTEHYRKDSAERSACEASHTRNFVKEGVWGNYVPSKGNQKSKIGKLTNLFYNLII